MTKWKQKRAEYKQRRTEFAKVAQEVFLKLYCEKTYNITMSEKEVKEARDSLCKAAWATADFMLEAEGKS